MNIAFPALLIFVLVLPGILLRYTYARGPWRWSSPTSLSGVSDEIAYSVVFALLLHIIWTSVTRLWGQDVDVRSVLVLLTGSYGPNSRMFEPAVEAISEHYPLVSLYLGTLYVFSAGLGYCLHWAVRHFGLDRRSTAFRFSNPWYYLLSGEILEFSELQHEPRAVDGVYVSAVVDHGGKSFLYRGILTDFWFTRSGELDRLLLRAAHRRSLSDDRHSSNQPDATEDTRYYNIEGDYFLLRYSETKTLNLDYFSLTPEESSAGSASGAPPALEPPSAI